MHFIASVIGVVLIVLVLVDGFEAVLLPRQVIHRFRFARAYYRGTWRVWRFAARGLPPGQRSAWMKRTPGIGDLPGSSTAEGHF